MHEICPLQFTSALAQASLASCCFTLLHLASLHQSTATPYLANTPHWQPQFQLRFQLPLYNILPPLPRQHISLALGSASPSPSTSRATVAHTFRPAKRMKYDLKETFDIIVGQEPAQRFTVYTDVLVPRSKFFAATRKPEWLAGNASKPVDLSDEDPDVFQTYLNCVYFGSEVLHEQTVEFKRQLVAFNVEFLVFVGDPNHDEKSLAHSLEEFGFKVKSVRFNSRTDYSCAYDVEFEDAEKATKALAHCNMKYIGGCFVGVCPSAARDQMANPARSGLADTGSKALIKVYLLVDKLQDLATANMIMDELIKFVAETGEIPKHGPTSLAYSSTAGSNPLRL